MDENAGKNSQVAQKLAETKSRVAALREKVQDEDTIKKQERVLKTELANTDKKEAPLKKIG